MNLNTIIFIVTALLAATCTFAEEMPEPGMTIDKSNYMRYRHFFPEAFLPAFEDGFDDIIAPIHMNIVQKKTGGIAAAYNKLSRKNKGKYGLDEEGDITGGWKYEGYPFPDVQPGDTNFATKLMWNYAARYNGDDRIMTSITCDKRRDGDPIWGEQKVIYLIFKGRIACDPNPNLPNPENLHRAILSRTKIPEHQRNNMRLSYRYTDPAKRDNIYRYNPSMRRPMRVEGMQRHTPIGTSINAADDIYIYSTVLFSTSSSLLSESRKCWGLPTTMWMQNGRKGGKKVTSLSLPNTLK